MDKAETCIVLAGGRGTRLARLTGGGNKHLAPLLGQPALLHVFPPIVATPTVSGIGVVTSAESGDEVKAVLAAAPGLEGTPVYLQDEPNGTLPAVLAARELLTEACFAVHYGDNIYGWNRLPPMADTFPDDAAAVLYCLAQRPPDFPRYGVVAYEERDGACWVRAFEEKPAAVPEEPFLLLSGFFRFRRDLFLEAAPRVPLSIRNEWELPAIVPVLQAQGHAVAVHVLDTPWNDYGTEESYPRAEHVLRQRDGN